MGMRALVSGQPGLLCPRPSSSSSSSRTRTRTRTRTTPRAASASASPSSSSSSSPPAPSLSLGATKPNAIIPVLAKDQRLDFTRRRTARAIPPLSALPLPQDADADDAAASSSSSSVPLEKEEDNALLFSGLYPGTVGIELILLALPAVLGQAIDPMAQLMETAYIGKLGALELASAGIGVAIFNILSKIFNIPLLSIATSFVAEDISKNASKHSTSGKLELPSVSSALVLAAAIGTIEALA